jgi:hypothetical protein
MPSSSDKKDGNDAEGKPGDQRQGSDPGDRGGRRLSAGSGFPTTGCPTSRPAVPNPIREMIRAEQFLISVEIRADRKSSLDALCRNAEEIALAGADLFDVPDNPGATVGRDATITAARLQDVLRVPSICHKAVTQSNLLQLHSGLMGAWDIGLRGVLAVTGDPPSMGPLGSLAQRVTDLKSSVELLRLIRKLREGELINGDRIADPPDFCAGATIGWPAPAPWARGSSRGCCL